jgi:hypothetical protein
LISRFRGEKIIIQLCYYIDTRVVYCVLYYTSAAASTLLCSNGIFPWGVSFTRIFVNARHYTKYHLDAVDAYQKLHKMTYNCTYIVGNRYYAKVIVFLIKTIKMFCATQQYYCNYNILNTVLATVLVSRVNSHSYLLSGRIFNEKTRGA